MGGSAGTLEASLPGPPVQGQGGRAPGQAFHRAENAPAQQGNNLRMQRRLLMSSSITRLLLINNDFVRGLDSWT